MKTMCDSSLIPVQKIVSWRRHVASKYVRITKDVERLYPERFLFAPAVYDPFDLAYQYQREISKLKKVDSEIVCQDETHTEFASRSLISPEKWQSIQDMARAARAKRKRRENYAQRVKDSKLRKGRIGGRLGNIGNNLEKAAKPTREKRFRIQRFIQAEGLSSSSHVCNCGCNISEVIHLKKNQEFGNVNIGGVATCGSVWACPVCRAKITNEREKQLKKIYSEGKKRGWYFTMLTFTIPHSKHDNLAALYGSSTLEKGLSGAFTAFRQSYAWSKKMKREAGFVGDVKAVEITYSEKNGFHPHIHMILLTKKPFDRGRWEPYFLKQWKKCCKNSDLGEPNEHGLRIDPVTDQSQVAYLAKWSAATELTSPDAKSAKKHSFSIADLELMLISQTAREKRGMGLQDVCSVLRSYYAAMKGQKQLQYGGLNTGWKDEVLPDDPDDEEITSEQYQEKEESLICMMSKKVYKKARRSGVLNRAIEHIESIERKSGNLHSMQATAILMQYLKRAKIPFENEVWGKKLFSRQFQK